MGARYYHLEGFDRIVKVEGTTAWIFKDGAWQESPWAYFKLSGVGGDADGREITADEAERLTAGADRARRFTWTAEDFESGGVFFHHGDEDPEG